MSLKVCDDSYYLFSLSETYQGVRIREFELLAYKSVNDAILHVCCHWLITLHFQTFYAIFLFFSLQCEVRSRSGYWISHHLLPFLKGAAGQTLAAQSSHNSSVKDSATAILTIAIMSLIMCTSAASPVNSHYMRQKKPSSGEKTPILSNLRRNRPVSVAFPCL